MSQALHQFGSPAMLCSSLDGYDNHSENADGDAQSDV
jgi:hypothetical protein